MKTAAAILTTIMACTSSTVSYAQSLADLAKREKERRERIETDARILTNSDAPQFSGGAVTTGSRPPSSAPQPASPDKADGDSPAQATKEKEAGEPVDLKGRSESFWRQTLADARQKIRELENESNVLELRLANLQTRFYQESNGFKQQEIQREIQKTFYQQDVNKQNLARATDQLDDLEKEARKSGALPGWLVPKTP